MKTFNAINSYAGGNVGFVAAHKTADSRKLNHEGSENRDRAVTKEVIANKKVGRKVNK